MRFFNLIVYRYLKTVIIMAKFELKFIDLINDEDFINVVYENQIINNKNETLDVICIRGYESNKPFEIVLDKSTAIKFAKTLRTEINKITQGELPTLEKGNFTTITSTPKKMK